MCHDRQTFGGVQVHSTRTDSVLSGIRAQAGAFEDETLAIEDEGDLDSIQVA